MTKMAFCKFYFHHIKWKSQPYTLHPYFLYRIHYRTRPVSAISLTKEVLFVGFYSTEKTFIIIEMIVKTLYICYMC